jgi:Helix-turn-helix domain (DUF4817)
MAPCTLNQRIFIVEQFYSNNKSVVKVQRLFRKQFSSSLVPCRKFIYRTVNKFRELGQLGDQRKCNRGLTTKCTPENVNLVSVAMTQSPKKSIRRASQQLGLSYGTVRKIVRKFLKLFPDKIQIEKPLKNFDKLRRLNFALMFTTLLTERPEILFTIWFSDEAHFWLDGYVNKQNMRFYATENPHLSISRPLHPQKTTVWCALSAIGIVGPIFIHETVTADVYRSQILDVFLVRLQELRVDISSAFFQQDGAKPHTANRVLDFIETVFGDRVLSNRYPERFNEGYHWPPYSPDINPCDFYLWGYLKDRVYENNPHSVEELEIAIRNEIVNINAATLESVVGNFAHRLEMICEAGDGGHFEHIIV